jgi:hypothetical protein
MSSTASATLATWFKIKGVSYSISSACATSSHCIGNGYELIKVGRQDVVFAGGCEELDWTLSVLFDAMGAMSSFAGIFALGASVEMIHSIGPANIEERVLELNRKLTARLNESGWKVLSPLGSEEYRSAETLVAAENPAGVVKKLAQQKVYVTEKPEGFRVSTDFFNNEDDIERLIDALK